MNTTPRTRAIRAAAGLLLAVLCVTSGAGAAGGGKAPPVAVFDGVVESTAGGFQFPDGTVLDSAAGSDANVVVVATSGGHFSSIQAALDSITDATVSNRYLVRVAPGVYTERVTLKPFVDVRGSGQLVTKITFTGTSSLGEATVLGADDVELSHLTVESTGGGMDYARAILNFGTSPRLTRLTADARDAETNIAIQNSSDGAPELTDVRAVAAVGTFNQTILNIWARPRLNRVDARAILGSSINYAIWNTAGSSMTVREVQATASTGAQAVGIFNLESSISGSDVQASAHSASGNSAVRNAQSTLSMDGGTFRANGAVGIAFQNESGAAGPSSALLRGVHLEATGTDAKAVLSVESAASIHHSLLDAQGSSSSSAVEIVGSAISDVQVAYSQVIGSIVGPLAQIACLGAYDGSLAQLDADCQ